MSTKVRSALEGVPGTLRALPRWVCWRYEQRNGKLTKAPYDARADRYASSTDPSTWADFETALAAGERYDGVGIVLGNGLSGVDLDNSLTGDGQLKLWAAQIVEQLSSYTEVSPSGHGVKLFLRGTLKRKGNRRDLGDGHVELYSAGRYFTVTGDHLPSTPESVQDRDQELDALHLELFPAREDSPTPPPDGLLDLSDRKLLQRMFAAANGRRIRQLWEGEVEGYPSHSEADAALCAHLAFWTVGDRERIDQLFRQSGLCREKWTERADYRERTITRVLEGRTDFYKPNADSPPPSATAEAEELLVRVTEVARVEDGKYDALRLVLDSAPVWASLRQADATQWEVTRARMRQLLPALRVTELDRRVEAETAQEARALKPWFDQDGNFVPLHLARKLGEGRLLRFRYALSPEGKEVGALMQYGNGVWRPVAGLRVAAQAQLGKDERNVRIEETLAAMARDVPQIPTTEWDRLPEHLINCRNGLVNLDTGAVEPHDPEHLCLSVTPWNYRSDARNVSLEQALRRILPGEDLVRVALMLAGYCLTPRQRAKVLAFLHGRGDSGKTTLLRWLRALVGEEACAAKTPQDLCENQFAAAALEGKLLNAPDELSTLSLRTVERLKALSGGGGFFDCEHKGQDSYLARMTATLVFACNDLPTGAGQADGAFYNRLLILPFGSSIPEDEQDPALRDEWPERPDIMEAFLCLAVDGLRALRANRWQFPKPEVVAQAVRQYRVINDPLSTFIEHRCVVLPKAQVLRSSFCHEFEEFCRETGIPAPTRKAILGRLRDEWHIQEPTLKGNVWLRGIGLQGVTT